VPVAPADAGAAAAPPGSTPADVCAHRVDGTATVRVVYFGGFVEGAIVDNLRAFYARYPGCVGRFCAWLVGAYGADADGGGVPALRAAAGRYLATLRGGGGDGAGGAAADVTPSAATAAAEAAAAAAADAGGVVHHTSGEPPLPPADGKAARHVGGGDSDGDVQTGLAEGDTAAEVGGRLRVRPPPPSV